MKRIIILFFIGFISMSIYAQGDIKLVPYEKHEKIKINRSNNIRQIIYSKNEQNAVSVEINPSDINKAQKAQLNIINLYDKEENIIAKSKPIDLYDWIVKPLGDNNTVLVIFPAGTARKAIIKVLKRQGNQLIETNEIERETAYFNIDISLDGKYYVCGFSAFDGISYNPEIKLFNNSGELLWSRFIDESRFYQVAISNKHVFGASKDSENKKGFMYLFDYRGKSLMKEEIDSHIGNYKIELSDYTNDKYFAISSLKNIYLFDSDKKAKIKEFRSDNNIEISDYLINNDGTIISTIMHRKYSKEKRKFDISNQQLIIEDIQNHKKSLKLDCKGKPLLKKDHNKVIIITSKNKIYSYHELQY